MSPVNPTAMTPSSAAAATAANNRAQAAGSYTIMTSRASSRSGRWTPDEKLLFLHGLKLYGRGRWKKIRQFLPTRSLIQIKSHAQKVLKRDEVGDDIFSPLTANKDKVEILLKDKTRLFQRDNPATLMSSDGRYHTITLQGGVGVGQQQLPPGGGPVACTLYFSCTYYIYLYVHMCACLLACLLVLTSLRSFYRYKSILQDNSWK